MARARRNGTSKNIWILTLIGGLLLVAALTWALIPTKHLPRATWLWDASLIEKSGGEVLAYLQQEQIGLLYLQINPNMQLEPYRSFIKSARLAGIEVHALDGAPEWAGADGKAASELSMGWLAAFQKSAAPEERFQGVHLDVEPYLLPEWKTNKQQTVEYYLEIIKKWSEFAQRQEIVIGLDIPFWYDEERIGQMSLFDWLLESTDTLTIMSYRNFVEGENGVLDITTYERDLSKKVGKSLYLALETEPSKEGPDLSFDSYPALMQAVTQLEKHLTDQQGIAIHHYERYRQLHAASEPKQSSSSKDLNTGRVVGAWRF